MSGAPPTPAAGGEQSKKPKDSAFRQQRLPAWMPVFSPRWVIATFFLVGIVFIPIGIAVLLTSNDIKEVSVEYQQQCSSVRDRKQGNSSWAPCSVTLEFSVPEKMKQPVYLYYQLDNFYQNHRRYVQSRDDPQLRGDERSYSQIENCQPVRSVGDLSGDPSSSLDKIFSPCGLIAWSMFNDSFTITQSGSASAICNTQDSANTPCTGSGVAWSSDKDVKFGAANSAYKYRAGGANPFYPNEPTHALPSQTNEDFMVWMRTAALPTFRKLYRIIKTDVDSGKYTLSITDNFPVQEFSGKKYMVLSTAAWIGGKNPFLGIAYLVVGSLSMLFGIVFGIKEVIAPRKEEDLRHLLESHFAAASPISE
eukprot:ANDGO_05291.mRNA.1 ALA-interacting subunit 1